MIRRNQSGQDFSKSAMQLPQEEIKSPTTEITAGNDEKISQLSALILSIHTFHNGFISRDKMMQLRELGMTDKQFQLIESRRGRLPGGMNNGLSTGSSSGKTTGEDQFDITSMPELQALSIPRNDVQIGKQLGKGGFGTVYEGTWAFRKVAVKCYEGTKLPDRVTREIRHEVSIMLRLDHECLVRFFGLVQEENYPAMLVMEYGANGSLYGYLHSDAQISWSKRWGIAEELARGLAYLHDQNIVHRDIKSLNIVLDKEHHAKWCDFGLAKLKQHATTTSKAEATGEGSLAGTLLWMAPELFSRKSSTPSMLSDMWALGMVLFELASREIPFKEAQTQQQAKDWILTGEGEEVPEECIEQAPEFGALMKRCWAAPNDRPTAAQIAVEVEVIVKRQGFSNNISVTTSNSARKAPTIESDYARYSLTHDSGGLKVQELQQNIPQLTECQKIQMKAKEQIRQITGQIEEAKQASQAKRGGDNSYLWDRIATKLEQARESWHKFNELVELGKWNKSTLWKKAAEESVTSAEGLKRAVNSYISGDDNTAKEIEKEMWSAYYSSDVSTWSLKSDDALEKTNQAANKDRDFWRNLAEQYKIAANYETKALEAHLANKEDERNSYTWIGRYLYSSADRRLKSKEAQETGRIILATGYREAAETSQQAAERRKEAIKAYVAGKKSVGHSWAWSGDYLQNQADYQAKACEAQEAGKTTLAAGYREIAITLQRASEVYSKGAERRASDKLVAGIHWEQEGSSLLKKANYQAKTAEAQEAGKTTLAAGYREAVLTSQRAADQYKLVAERTDADGYADEFSSWEEEGSSLLKKANYQAKTAEAQEAGKTTLAAGYREAAAISQKAADLQKLSAEKKIARTWMTKKNCSWQGNSEGSFEGFSIQAKADYQAKAAEAQEAGKTQLAVGYREAATIAQLAADQHKQAAIAFASGKENEGDNCFYEGKSLQAKAEYQARAAEAQEAGELQKEVLEKIEETKRKSREVDGTSFEGNWLARGFDKCTRYWELAFNRQQAGKTSEAAVYREAAATYQRGTELKQLGLKMMEANKNNEGNSLCKRGERLQEKVECLIKEAKETLQQAADYHEQAALAYKTGKDTVGDKWNNAGASLKKKVDYQIKAREYKDEGKLALVTGHQMAAEISQKAADEYKQSALAYIGEKETIGNNLRLQAELLLLQAEYHVKATETQGSGRATFARCYQEAAATLQNAINQLDEFALAYNAEKESESICLSNKIQSLQCKVKYQVKAFETQDAIKLNHLKEEMAKLAAAYRESVALSERAEEQHKQSLQALISGNNSRLTSCNREGNSLQEKANAIVTKAEKDWGQVEIKFTKEGKINVSWSTSSSATGGTYD